MCKDEASLLPFGIPLSDGHRRAEFDATLVTSPTEPRTVEAGIPMRDGIELAADIHLPSTTLLPAPAIVTGTPYDKASANDDVRFFRDAGYVSVSYDVRGRGKSEGEWGGHANDAADGHDVVEWIAAQDWCSGKVGAVGLSYSGYVVWATMSRHPPHLHAAISISASGRFMQEVPYTYGCFWLYYAYWFAYVRRRINDTSRDVGALLKTLPVRDIGTALDVSGSAWDDTLQHDQLDSYWEKLRWDGEYDFDVPVLHVTGWHDREDLQGAFHHYQQMMSTSPAKDRQWLLVGPWSHVSCRFPSDVYAGVEAPGGALDMNAIQLQFFDKFLKGSENHIHDEPRVWMYDPGDRDWKTRPRWGGGVTTEALYLADEGRLIAQADLDSSAEYRYDPLRPAGIRFDADAPLWEPPLDLAEFESQPGVLAWTSEDLVEALTVHGWGECVLYATTDREDTDWHLKLTDVAPGGQSHAVAWGCLRASNRNSLRSREPVIPNVITKYTVELTPMFHTFQKGHRLRMLVSSSDYPWFARNLNEPGPIADQSEPRVATNIIHSGVSHPSCLCLPVEPRSGNAC